MITINILTRAIPSLSSLARYDLIRALSEGGWPFPFCTTPFLLLDQIHKLTIYLEVRFQTPTITYAMFFMLQEVPTFRDFWYQRLIMKFGDHEFRGPFLVLNLKMGPKIFQKSTF